MGNALIERVKQFPNLNRLYISDSLVIGEEKVQEVGVRLAKIMSTNTTVENLILFSTDLIGADNAEQWGDALMKNTTLTELKLLGVEDEIVDKLKTRTKN